MKNFFENEPSSDHNKVEYDEPSYGQPQANATTIHHGMRLTGKVEGRHNFTLNGELDGKVNVTELFKVGGSGKFKGEVKAKVVIVEGEFEGKIAAEEKVQIMDSGNYKGDVVSPSIYISDKAFFQGTVTMTKKDQSGQNVSSVTVVDSEDYTDEYEAQDEEYAEELTEEKK